MMLGQIDQAIEAYSHAIELKSGYAHAYNNRGVAYTNKGEFDKAIVNYTKAIDLKPDFASAYNNRGATYAAKGDYDRAIEDFNKAIDLNPITLISMSIVVWLTATRAIMIVPLQTIPKR